MDESFALDRTGRTCRRLSSFGDLGRNGGYGALSRWSSLLLFSSSGRLGLSWASCLLVGVGRSSIYPKKRLLQSFQDLVSSGGPSDSVGADEQQVLS